MKVLIVIGLIIVSSVSAKICRPKYHFWRPYNGSIPNDAFVAGIDEDGRQNYVAKIIPLDQYLWTIPAQLREGDDHVKISWCCSDGKVKPFLKVDRFIEILCVDNPYNLKWSKVDRFADEAISECCLIEGGIALYDKHTYVSYIGKGVVNGKNFIGRVYLERDWPGIGIMDGTNSTKIFKNFEVLSYDCNVGDIDIRGNFDIYS